MGRQERAEDISGQKFQLSVREKLRICNPRLTSCSRALSHEIFRPLMLQHAERDYCFA